MTSRQRLFEIMRVQNVYQAAVRKKINCAWFVVSLDQSTSLGKRNHSSIVGILDKARERKVNVSHYITASFQSWHQTPKDKYPKLAFLNSDKGFERYEKSLRILKTSWVTDEAVEAYLEAAIPTKNEDKFKNAFYNGFMVLERTVETFPPLRLYEESVVKLFGVFLAWPEWFTPEFMVTHSRFEELQKARDLTHLGRELRKTVMEHTKECREKIDRQPSLFTELMVSRRTVAKDEHRLVVYLHGLKGRNARVWKLME